ncbi:uncharacterized protein LOC127137767 [Lathyrus oleraceus]|uniref:uncharacterized protein LOC127137767 n=1 Tax=Pisum sativum TaxID=3888 RepID=UPI0021CE0626|nr:uncharacterized protein LOC127137767 [Pisum sativum]
MSESDHSEHSGVNTHKSADTGDFDQSKNTTFRGSKSEFHPTLAVPNIRNHIPIILEMEKDQYGTWAELFRIHAHSHRVLYHIVPTIGKEPPVVTDANHEQWSTLDATVIQWIYFTISTDLLITIVEPNSTAIKAWNRLEYIFQDNQNARAVTLEQELSNTRMEDFPNVSAICQRFKMIYDQLRNHRVVLQLIFGLPKAYRSVATLILQRNPLPKFYQARSMLTLKEASMAKMANIGSHAAMHTTQSKPTKDTSQRDNFRPDNRSHSRGNQGRGGGRGNRSSPHSRALSASSPWFARPWQQQHYPTWQP